MDITISASSCANDVYLPWDTRWNRETQQGAWVAADPDEIGNIGGLRAKSAIETAVIISYFTDKACPTDHPLYKYCEGDPRGWWGDSIHFDDDFGELGSLLWVLERSVVKATGIDMAQWAEAFAIDSLAWMKSQNVASLIKVNATAFPANRGLQLDTGIFGQNGQQIYSSQFDILWQQVRSR